MSEEQLMNLRNHGGSAVALLLTAYYSIRVDYIKSQLMIWRPATQLFCTSSRDSLPGVLSFHPTRSVSYLDTWRQNSEELGPHAQSRRGGLTPRIATSRDHLTQ